MDECIVCYNLNINKVKLNCNHSNSCDECWNKYQKECIRSFNLPKCFICRNETIFNFTWYNILLYFYNCIDYGICEYYEL